MHAGAQWLPTEILISTHKRKQESVRERSRSLFYYSSCQFAGKHLLSTTNNYHVSLKTNQSNNPSTSVLHFAHTHSQFSTPRHPHTLPTYIVDAFILTLYFTVYLKIAWLTIFRISFDLDASPHFPTPFCSLYMYTFNPLWQHLLTDIWHNIAATGI